MSRSSIKAKLVMAQSLATFMDSGVNNATIVFYQGEIPAVTKDSAYPDNVLVTLEFPKPCFKEITTSYVELYPTNTATVIKTGTATWARIYNGAGETAVDLEVGPDIGMASANLVMGGTFSVTSVKLKV